MISDASSTASNPLRSLSALSARAAPCSQSHAQLQLFPSDPRICARMVLLASGWVLVRVCLLFDDVLVSFVVAALDVAAHVDDLLDDNAMEKKKIALLVRSCMFLSLLRMMMMSSIQFHT